MTYTQKLHVLGKAYELAIEQDKDHELPILEALVNSTYNRGNAYCPIKFDDFREIGVIWPIKLWSK